jgi:proliferating cell nuclear antigen
MFEARLLKGETLKKVVEAIRELVTDANIDCSHETGLCMQAMDSSHVSLCALSLRPDAFDEFRCDKNVTMGVHTSNLSKLLKCSGNDDIVTLKCEEDADTLNMTFESAKQDRISEFGLKLMDIESEHLGIPDTEYKCNVKMPSAEFQRIIRDLAVLGDTCKISVNKEGICFSGEGDLGKGKIMLKHNTAVDKDEEAVVIDMQEPVELNFALRYLTLFTKATALGPLVILSMSPDIPIVVEYPVDSFGYVRYYLAPKIDD